MKYVILAFISNFFAFQLFSLEKVKEFDLEAGVTAFEAFERLESIVNSQGTDNISILVSPTIPEKPWREIKLRNLPPSQIIAILCSGFRLSYLQHEELFIVTENDKTLYKIRESLQIGNEDIIEIVEKIKRSSLIILTEHKGEKNHGRISIITEILKDDSNTVFNFMIGQEFPEISKNSQMDMVSQGDGHVIFLEGNPLRWTSRLTYKDNFLLSVKGMTLTELRRFIESSDDRTKRRRQPSELARKF